MPSPFYRQLREYINRKGGAFNAHLHLDRAGTLDIVNALTGSESWSGRLEAKHSLISVAHLSEAYSDLQLRERALHYSSLLVEAGTSTAETFIDVTNDNVGLRAIEQFAAVRSDLQDKIRLRLGAYNPLGFARGDHYSLSLLKESLAFCDFIGALPERDELSRYPDHIGFEASCIMLYELALESKTDLHVHVDQRNDPRQRETIRMLKALSKVYQVPATNDDTRLWLVHFISPSRYDENEFSELSEILASLKIGVICCPSAALSMRQLRSRITPTSNSIARVLDLCAAGVDVRLGSDNIYDVASPAGTPDLLEEVICLCNSERFYDLDIVSSLACGEQLTASQRDVIRLHLERNLQSIAEMSAEL